MERSGPLCTTQQALDILTGSDHQPFDIDLPQASQAELVQTMPLFGFSEQRLGPELALAHGFLVSLRRSISRRPVKIRLEERPMDGASGLTRGAFSTNGTGLTRLGIRPILEILFRVDIRARYVSGLALWAEVDILVGLVAKAFNRIKLIALGQVGRSADRLECRSCSSPTMLATVPYLVSPTAMAGCSCQRKRAQRARSSMGYCP